MRGLKVIFSALFVGIMLTAGAQTEESRKTDQKMMTFVQLLKYMYVDSMSFAPIYEKGMIEMLKDLDPHSVYISEKDVQKANEPLEGNFDGIGVSFQVLKDTIVIVDVISGGPSEKLGIMPGDRIIQIDGVQSTGDSATTNFVFKRLRGKKGTKVEVSILRKGAKAPLLYVITRDKIPINSVDTYFMENKTTGYIRLDRFSKTTTEEVLFAINDLKSKGMKNLIFDLRGNTGGYLAVAVELSNQFIGEGKKVVYMEGKAQPKQEFFADSKGNFEKGRLVVLVDEGSASASEIVSGAVQDWDRGIVIGRRTFGKGLVQRPFDMPDQSVIRLTTARYYTPSGRCIQKPYEDGLDSYYADIMNRYSHGEMLHPDSVKMPDSLRYYTNNKRLVYGGGGIMPDVFVPIDTQRVSDFYVDLRRNNVLNSYVMDLMDKQRKELLEKYPDFAHFDAAFSIDAYWDDFLKFADQMGVERKNMKVEKAEYFLRLLCEEMEKDSALKMEEDYQSYVKKVLWSPEKMQSFLLEKAKEEDQKQAASIAKSDEYIKAQLTALIARNLYGVSYYFQSIKTLDTAYQRALKVIEDKKLFQQLNISF